MTRNAGRMSRTVAALVGAATLAFATIPARAASTVNPGVPAANGPMTSLPLRQNFQAAATDINNILGQFAGTTAPTNPSTFQTWCNTGTSPYQCSFFDGAVWVAYGFINASTHQFSPYFSSLSFSATAPISASVSAGVATISLNINSTLTVSSNNLGLNLATANTWTGAQLFTSQIGILPGSGQAALQLGTASIATSPLIDFHASASNAGYGVRLLATDSGSATGGGSLGVLGSLAISPLANSANPGIAITQTGPSSGTIGATNFGYNTINVSNDQLSASLYGAVTSAFYVTQTSYGADGGTKAAGNFVLSHPIATNAVVPGDYIGLNGTATSGASFGGTDTGSGAKGTVFGAGFVAQTYGTATNIFEVAGVEFDVSIEAGSSSKFRFGVSSVDGGSQRGAALDAALEVGATGSGWGCGLCFASIHGKQPVGSVSPIATGSRTAAGTGYVNGTYSIVPLTGGSGTGAQATITVAGGIVSSVLITQYGGGYTVGDVLSASNTNLGGSGSGFTWTVATVGGTTGTLIGNDAAAAIMVNFADLHSYTFTGDLLYFSNYRVTSAGATTVGSWTATKIGLAYGGTNADLSATGGTSQVLQQITAGGAITVGQLAASNLSNGTTGSGAIVLTTSPTLATPVINGLPTGTGVASANTASTLVSRDGSGNFSAGTITAALSGNATTATSATNTAITDDTATNATVYLTWVTANTGSLPQKVTSTKLAFNPASGNLASTTFNALTITANGGNAINIAANKTLAVNNTLTFTGTDGSSVAFGTGGTVTYTSNNLSAFAATTSAQLASVLSDKTGTGLAVFNNAPALTAPTIAGGTHSAITSLGIRSTGAAFDLTLASTEVFTAGRTLTLTLNDAARTINLSGNLTLAGAVSLPVIAQGDLWYGSAAGVVSALAKDTGTSRFLKNSGTSNNPAWAQPAFTDISGTIATGQVSGSYTGITGLGTITAGATGTGFIIDLGNSTVSGRLAFANLTQGSARSVLGVAGNATADNASIQGTTDQVMRVTGAGTGIGFGSIDLSKSAAVGASILPKANGGCGVSGGGTWTPTIAFGGASVGITYGTRTGNYTQCGDFLVATANIVLTSKGSSTGSAQITGLPASCASTIGGAVISYYSGMSSMSAATGAATGSSINLYNANATASAALTDTNFSNTTNVNVTAFCNLN